MQSVASPDKQSQGRSVWGGHCYAEVACIHTCIHAWAGKVGREGKGV